jgi:hypothetical protein
MPEAAATGSNLAHLLQQLRLQQPSATTADAGQAQLDLLLGRVSMLTDALRQAPDDDASRTAARLVLADLSMVAARLRGDVALTSERLNTVLEQVRSLLESGDSGRAGTA